MDNALKEMVFKYGFRTVHTALIELAEIIRKDAEEFQKISYPLAPRRSVLPETLWVNDDKKNPTNN